MIGQIYHFFMKDSRQRREDPISRRNFLKTSAAVGLSALIPRSVQSYFEYSLLANQYGLFDKGERLRTQLNGIVRSSKGEWHVAIKQVGGRTLYSLDPDRVIHPASTIKVPLSMAFISKTEEEPDLNGFLEKRGTSGRTFHQLLHAMLVHSEEEATQALTQYLGISYIHDKLHSWGTKNTTVVPRRSTASEMMSLLEGLFQGRWHTVRARDRLLSYMSSYTPMDDTRLGVMRANLPKKAIIYNKRGTVYAPLVVADAGLVQVHGLAYAICFFGYGGRGAIFEELIATLENCALKFSEFVSGWTPNSPLLYG